LKGLEELKGLRELEELERGGVNNGRLGRRCNLAEWLRNTWRGAREGKEGREGREDRES